MKIQEFAKVQNLSNNAIYKAIKRAGYSAKELTDKQGNITSKGFIILNSIYHPDGSAPAGTIPDHPDGTQSAGESAKMDLLQSEINRLKEENKELKERAEKWEQLYLELQIQASQERAEHSQQLLASQQLLSQQQEIHRLSMMNPIRRLLSGKSKKTHES